MSDVKKDNSSECNQGKNKKKNPSEDCKKKTACIPDIQWVACSIGECVVDKYPYRTGPYLYTKRFDGNGKKLPIPEGTLIRVTFTARLVKSSLGNDFDFYIHCGPDVGLKEIDKQSKSKVEYRANGKGDGGVLYKGLIAEGLFETTKDCVEKWCWFDPAFEFKEEDEKNKLVFDKAAIVAQVVRKGTGWSEKGPGGEKEGSLRGSSRASTRL